jgi:hypothetical protein
VTKIACAKLAVYRQIKEREIAPHASYLKPNANGPNVLGLEWRFLPDE